jgi:hypothetical protein
VHPVAGASGASSGAVTASAKFAAEASQCATPCSASSSGPRYRSIVYISAMVFEIGVPLANTTLRPPVSSRMYLVFMNMSKARLLSELGRPAMRLIFVV